MYSISAVDNDVHMNVRFNWSVFRYIAHVYDTVSRRKCTGTAPCDGIFYITHAWSVNLAHYLFRPWHQWMPGCRLDPSHFCINYVLKNISGVPWNINRSLRWYKSSLNYNALNNMQSWLQFEEGSNKYISLTGIYQITMWCFPQLTTCFPKTDSNQSTLPDRGLVMRIFFV